MGFKQNSKQRKFAVGDVDQNSLVPIHCRPGQDEENDQQNDLGPSPVLSIKPPHFCGDDIDAITMYVNTC
nr:hypothetical protein BdHM001_22670 [Bdellovibrio sp. HM001]